jgi:hypothetical protein
MSDFAWFCLMFIAITVVMYATDIIEAWRRRGR